MSCLVIFTVSSLLSPRVWPYLQAESRRMRAAASPRESCRTEPAIPFARAVPWPVQAGRELFRCRGFPTHTFPETDPDARDISANLPGDSPATEVQEATAVFPRTGTLEQAR